MKDHHDDKADRQHEGELHIADRGANGLRPIGQNRDFHGGRDRRFELRQQRLDAINGGNDVGARLTLNPENDRPLLVSPAGDKVVLRPIDRPTDIFGFGPASRFGKQQSDCCRRQA